jgi:hypothetical protein
VHVDVPGSGPRVVLVHGNVARAMQASNAVRPLAARFTLVVSRRGGYPPNPPERHSGAAHSVHRTGEPLNTGLRAPWPAPTRSDRTSLLQPVEPSRLMGSDPSRPGEPLACSP